MKILVTGGAGFIGSATAKRLVDDGHDVIVVDNFNTYYDQKLKRDRVEALIPTVSVLELDVTDSSGLDKLFSEHSFDGVCHFAAQAGVRYSVEAPEVYVTTNVLGTQTLLETMKKHNVRQFVYASTSSAYGIDTPVPFNENTPADRPVSVYAATKRAGELLAHSYHKQVGTKVTCLRFFTVYGPWSRPDMAMLKFASKMKVGDSIDVYNSGDLRRDFTYIDDIVQGFVLALKNPLDYEIINLGNGAPIELLHFVDLLEKELGLGAKKNMLPMQTGDVYETYADTSKAKELLGFEATTDFATGVKRFVDWYQTYYN